MSNGYKRYASEEYVNEIVDTLAQNKLSVPATASVGQTIIVATIDEDGKPLTWEIVTPELISNKVTSITSDTTDEQYPSAKAVYNELNAITDSLSKTATEEYVDAKLSAFQLVLTDENTGKKYKLTVVDGNLTMTEVASE
jgi:hypothetical protein